MWQMHLLPTLSIRFFWPSRRAGSFRLNIWEFTATTNVHRSRLWFMEKFNCRFFFLNYNYNKWQRAPYTLYWTEYVCFPNSVSHPVCNGYSCGTPNCQLSSAFWVFNFIVQRRRRSFFSLTRFASMNFGSICFHSTSTSASLSRSFHLD